MNKNAPYYVLLAVTIAITGAGIAYNLFFQNSFGVAVRYSFPQVVNRSVSETDDAVQEAAADAILVEEEPWEAEDIYYEADPEAGTDQFPAYLEEPDADEPEDVVEFPLDLNTATYEELILIPRVGDVTAQRILQYRDHLGGYEALEQLMEIKGIGEATFARIAPYLYV